MNGEPNMSVAINRDFANELTRITIRRY